MTAGKTLHDLDFLFHPRSVAIAGASTREVHVLGGTTYVTALQDMGFRGPLYVIHPTAEAVRGVKCYRSLRDIPDVVDYVISAVPARVVPELLEDCIAHGVKALHMLTAGFTETGDAERAKMEQAIIRRAREGGVRLIGPNCMGIYAPEGRLAMGAGMDTEPGPVGMLSQSGANAQEFVRFGHGRGLRYSKVISFGNGADLGAADFLDYFADDDSTGIVTAYLEGIQDGPRLAAALRRAARLKPVIILKGGRTEAGSRAATSHTASLAGSDQVFDALCRQAGAIRVGSMDELVDAAVTFRFAGELRGPNVVVAGGGGGISVLAADDLAAAGLAVPPLPLETQETIAKVTHEAGTSVRNPVDVPALWNDAVFEATLNSCASAPNVDVLLFHTSFGGGSPSRDGDPRTRMERQVQGFVRIQEEAGKPVVVAIRPATGVSGFAQSQEFQSLCWRAGIATYPSIERAARGLAAVLARQQMLGE